MQFESSGEPEKAIKHYQRGVSRADSASYYVSGSLFFAQECEIVTYPFFFFFPAPGNDDSFGSTWSAPGFQHWIGIHSIGSAIMRPKCTSRCICETFPPHYILPEITLIGNRYTACFWPGSSLR
jgi:hypothetical protein